MIKSPYAAINSAFLHIKCRKLALNGVENKGIPKQVSTNGKISLVGKLNDGAVIKVVIPPTGKTYYKVHGEFFTQTYPRILIRNKKVEA